MNISTVKSVRFLDFIYLIVFSFILIISGFGIPRISTFFTLFIVPLYVWLNTVFLKENAFVRIDTSLFKKEYFIFPVTILFFFCVIYFFVAGNYGYIEYNEAIVYFVKIIIFYGLGFFLNFRQSPFGLSSTLLICLSIVSGGIFTSYLSITTTAGINLNTTNYQFSRRSVYSFWSGQEINGPSIDLLSYFGVSLLPLIIELLILLLSKKQVRSPLISAINAINLILSVILFYLSVYSSLSLLARTPILCFFSSILVYILRKSFLLKNKIKFISKYGLFFLGTIIIIFCLQFILSEGITSFVESFAITQRIELEGSETPRYIVWLTVLLEMWQYPFGGREITIPASAAHNIWLDVAFDAGILPMFFLVIFHFMHISHFYKIFIYQSDILGLLVVCFVVAILSSFIGSAVLQASVDYFAITCFFVGLILGISKRYDNSNIFRR
jgi:hypothetical protein